MSFFNSRHFYKTCRCLKSFIGAGPRHPHVANPKTPPIPDRCASLWSSLEAGDSLTFLRNLAANFVLLSVSWYKTLFAFAFSAMFNIFRICQMPSKWLRPFLLSATNVVDFVILLIFLFQSTWENVPSAWSSPHFSQAPLFPLLTAYFQKWHIFTPSPVETIKVPPLFFFWWPQIWDAAQAWQSVGWNQL